MILEEHGMVQIGGGCSCGCRFCTRSEGRIGPPVDMIDAGNLPLARRVTILAGDLIDERIEPVVTALRANGTADVFLYAHPACRDVGPLKRLTDAGLTGIHLMLPSAADAVLKKVCAVGASARNAALVIKAANSLGLKIHFEIPVLGETSTTVDDTVRRALKLAAAPSGISLPFRSTHGPGGLAGWDFRDASASLRVAVQTAVDAGVPLNLGGFEGAAPCVFNPEGAVPEWYPELDSGMKAGVTRPDALDSTCSACAILPACFMGMQAFCAGGLPVEPVARLPESAAGVSVRAADLFLRRTDLNRLLKKAATIERCPAPWDSLEMHDRTGRVAPCEGTWPRREILGTPDGSGGSGWFADGILNSFNNPGMVRMRAAMVADGREASCNRHCPRYSETFGMRPRVRLPRTAVYFDNLAKNLAEFIDGATVLESRPLNITISPSLRCNQRCRMCDLNDAEAGATGFDTPPRILDELERLLPTVGTLALTGGEPLTSRRIVDLMAAITPAELPDTRITMTTNGTLLGPDVIERLRGSNLAAVFVSLNSATARGHEMVTGVPGRFDLVVRNVAAMVKAAESMPLRPAVIMSFVVMRSTIHELGPFIDLARRLGTGIRLLPIERNREGESIFTDAATLEHAETVVRTIHDRYMREWTLAAPAIAALHSIIKMKLDEDDGRPI